MGEFRPRYWAELSARGDLLTLLKYRAAEGDVTFVYAAHDEKQNSAAALKEYLEKKLGAASARSRRSAVKRGG